MTATIHRRLPAAIAIALTLALAPGLAGAAGEHAGGHAGYGHAGSPEDVDRTVEIDAAGTDFSRDRVEVESGETIRFVVTNTGTTVHEFTIGPPSVQKQHRAEMREMMAARSEGHGHGDGHGHQDAGPMQGMSHQHANSVLVQPGETRELIWTFEDVHDVKFGCNVPGHYEAGMHGDFVHGH